MNLCVAAGFTVVRPEEHTLVQQARMFNGAGVIVGVKGAALTNVMFCNSAASVVVLSPNGWVEPFFWDLAGQMGIRYAEVFGDTLTEGGHPSTAPFRVDLRLVVRAVEEAVEAWAEGRQGMETGDATVITAAEAPMDFPWTGTAMGALPGQTMPIAASPLTDSPLAASLPVAAFPPLADEEEAFARYQATLPVTDTARLEETVRALDILPGPARDAPETISPPEGTITAHVHNMGDIRCQLGDWAGIPGSGLWLEGLCITSGPGIADDDIEYQIVQTPHARLPWVSGGTFCGTRGMSLPVLGVCVRLRGAAAARFDCLYAATFVDGTRTGPLSGDSLCEATTQAPLEALQIVFRPRVRSLA